MNQLIGYLSEGEQLKGSLTIPQQLGGSTLGSKTITANGVYDATDDGLDGYDVVTANVPNTYAAGDEGKVVDNGALVSQTTATYSVNNTYDTTKIKSVTVNVGGGSPTLETITKTYTPTTSQQTEQITPSSGYDGIAEVDVTVNAMPTGTEGTPIATKGAVSNHSVAVTPSVTNQAGYIAGGTKTGTAVTVSASELDSGTKSITANGNNQDVVGYAAVDVAVPNSYSAADEGKVVSSGALVAQTAHADVTPTTSDQTIDTTTNNSIKVKGDADLVAGNIKKDVEIFGVTGSYEGSGGGGYTADEIASGSAPSGAVTITTTSLNQNGLSRRGGITSLVVQNATSIPGNFADNCANIESLSLPSAISFSGNSAFSSLTSLRTLSAPQYVGTTSAQYSFAYCPSLEAINLPKAKYLGKGTFLQDRKVASVYCPLVESVSGDQTFAQVGADAQLQAIALPSLTSMSGQNVFTQCSTLTAIDLGMTTGISGNYSFNNCSSLITLVLRANSVATLGNINSFTNTPFASGKTGGTLYVPSSLVSSYQSASNWSTILGYTNNQIKSIESTHTDPNAPIDLTLYYADGTPISA